jgi:hypothetical protein
VPFSDLAPTPEPGSSYGLQRSPFRDLFGSRTPVANVEDWPVGEPVKFTEAKMTAATVDCAPFHVPNVAEPESELGDGNRGFTEPPLPTDAALKRFDATELLTIGKTVGVDAGSCLDRRRDPETEEPTSAAAQIPRERCEEAITRDATDSATNVTAGTAAAATDCAEVTLVRTDNNVADDLHCEPDAVLSCNNETNEFVVPGDAVPADCYNEPCASAIDGCGKSEKQNSTVSVEAVGQTKRKVGGAYSQETVSLSIVRQTVTDLVYHADKTRPAAMTVKQENLVLRPAKVLARATPDSSAACKFTAPDSVSCLSSAGELSPSAFKPVQQTTETTALSSEADDESAAELAEASSADELQSTVLQGIGCVLFTFFCTRTCARVKC